MPALLDPQNIFLKSIGAARLDPNGRPIGSTGGMIAMNQDQEAELARINQPQQGGMQPVAGVGVGGGTSTNPLDKLNKVLGLNLGNPTQNMATRQAVDAMSPQDQIGSTISLNKDNQFAAQYAQRVQDRGGFSESTMPGEAERNQAIQERVYREMVARNAGGGNSFIPGSDGPVTAYAPTGLRSRAIAANGAEVAGIGDVMASASQNAAGGTNFNLRQISRPVTAAPVVAPVAPVNQPGYVAMGADDSYPQSGQAPATTQQRPAVPAASNDPLAVARQKYDAATTPAVHVPAGFRAKPDGSLTFIPGGPADPAYKAAADSPKPTQTQRNAEYVVEQGIKAGTIKPEDKEEAVAVFSQEMMGRAPKLSAPERDTAVGNAKYLQSLDALRAAVSEVPEGGFGPIDTRLKRLAGDATGAYRNISKVDQLYKETAATKAFGEGGKQLTGTEKDITFGQLGDPTNADFPSRLATHYDRARNVATLQLERLKASPHRFTAEGQAAIGQLEKALSSNTGGAESVGGKKPSSAATKAPPGVDPGLWAHMTDHEKALWN